MRVDVSQYKFYAQTVPRRRDRAPSRPVSYDLLRYLTGASAIYLAISTNGGNINIYRVIVYTRLAYPTTNPSRVKPSSPLIGEPDGKHVHTDELRCP